MRVRAHPGAALTPLCARRIFFAKPFSPQGFRNDADIHTPAKTLAVVKSPPPELPRRDEVEAAQERGTTKGKGNETLLAVMSQQQLMPILASPQRKFTTPAYPAG